jgi:flagellar motor switch protein FliM
MADYSDFTPEVLTAMPVLLPNDVAQAVTFILSLPARVLVIILRFSLSTYKSYINLTLPYYYLSRYKTSSSAHLENLGKILQSLTVTFYHFISIKFNKT